MTAQEAATLAIIIFSIILIGFVVINFILKRRGHRGDANCTKDEVGK